MPAKPARCSTPRSTRISSSSQPTMPFDFEQFKSRHIGPDAAETAEMLKTIGAASLDALIDEAIPSRIRLRQPLDLAPGKSEHHFLKDLRAVAARNQIFRSFIGLGYHDTV